MPRLQKWIDDDTRDAIIRMIRYMDDDAKIAAHVAAPFQNITAETISMIRRHEKAAGRLAQPHMIGLAAADMEPLDINHSEIRAEKQIRAASAMLAKAIVRAHA